MKYVSLKGALLCASALVISATTVSQSANAAGFYIQEQSVKGLGAAFSNSVTNLNDPSTIYFNAAGMTRLEGVQGQIGVHIIDVDADLTDTGTVAPGALAVGGSGGDPGDPAVVPNAFVSYQLSNDLWAGFGFSAPFGLESEYDDGWFGRFDSTKTDLKTHDLQLSLAHQLNDRLAISGGINIQHAEADLRKAVFAGVTEGESALTGEDWSFGYNFGALYDLTDETTLGLSYRSSVAHDLDGHVVVAGTGNPAADRNDEATASLKTPDIATFGIAHDLDDRWTVTAQATWFGWHSFDQIDPQPKSGSDVDPTVQGYTSSWAYAIGAEYKATDKWTLRTGFQFDETPTVDEYRTTLTPDGDRTWFALGGTYDWSDSISLDIAATYIDIEEENINLTRNIPALPATVRAKTDNDILIGSLAMTYKF